MKLNLNAGGVKMLEELSRFMGLAPMFALSLAVLMTVLAVFAVKDFVAVNAEQTKAKENPKFEVNKAPVSAKAYENYAFVLQRISQGVKVTADKDKLVIESPSADTFPEFMYVLNSIQGLSNKVIWKAEEICLAGCQGAASKAIVSGFEEKVKVTLRGNES
jgi:hypothetical protein